MCWTMCSDGLLTRSPPCSPPQLPWLHPGSTRSTPALPVGQPTRVRRTGLAVGPRGRRPPCTDRPLSRLHLPEGRDFPIDRRVQAAIARGRPLSEGTRPLV